MTWSDFYLICFAVGFCFSFFSFVFGSPRMGRLHLPHFHGHDSGHLSAAHAPVAHGSVAGGDAHAPSTHTSATDHSPRHTSVSPFNPPSLAAFLAWFGGTGWIWRSPLAAPRLVSRCFLATAMALFARRSAKP